MKIVSPLAVVTAVLLTVLVVGCSSGPGKAPDEEMPPDEMPATPPAIQVFSGTFEVTPADFVTGTITATITGISHDGTALADPALAAAIALLGGAEQTFNYTLSPGMTSTSITLTGDLLMKLMVPGGMVSATRLSVPNPLAPLDGNWEASLTDPQTMATTSLSLHITDPDFTLTVDNTPPSS